MRCSLYLDRTIHKISIQMPSVSSVRKAEREKEEIVSLIEETLKKASLSSEAPKGLDIEITVQDGVASPVLVLTGEYRHQFKDADKEAQFFSRNGAYVISL